MIPQKTTNIEQFIKSGEGVTITYFNMSFLDKVSNGSWVTIKNAVSDYMTELSNATVNVSLTYDQQLAYFYKPKLLCYDIYGNPELYYIILLLNDMADVKEFTKPVIKMLKKEHMNKLISAIYNAEAWPMESYNDKTTAIY